MDQIASLLNTIDTYRPRHEDQFDPMSRYSEFEFYVAVEIIHEYGNKILEDDIQVYYSNNAITVNESMRPKIREVFGNVLNLLNPPNMAIDMQLSNLRKVAGLVYEEYFNTRCSLLRIPNEREAAIEDVKTILLNNQKYLQRYKEYALAFDNS